MTTKTTCTRRIQFCAGHRVMDHESKCRNLHGHNYVVYFTAELDTTLDSLGRVVDFSVLKALFGGWIDENWDHGFVLFEKDKEAISVLSTMENQKIAYMPYNPTAENMAHYLLHDLAPELLADHEGLRLVKVRVEETENCAAEVSI